MTTPDQRSQPARPMAVTPGWRVARVGGVELRLRATWIPLAVLLAWSFGTQFAGRFPGGHASTAVWSIAFALVLTACLVAHEVAHAVAARRAGLPVSTIEVGFVAAGTTIEAERRSPGQEFWVAAVGPLTSLALALVGFGAVRLGPPDQLLFALDWLVSANLVLGILNLLPGLPLDGGWIVRAAVWKVTGDPHRGTIAAAWSGRVLAVLIVLVPFALSATGRSAPALSVFVTVMIAAFVWMGATVALRRAELTQRLPQLRVADLARRAVAVLPSTPVSEGLRLAAAQQAGAMIVLDADDRPHALVSETALQHVPPERRPWTLCADIAVTIDDRSRIRLDEDGQRVVQMLQEQQRGEYLVTTADGDVYGVLAASDVQRALSGPMSSRA